MSLTRSRGLISFAPREKQTNGRNNPARTGRKGPSAANPRRRRPPQHPIGRPRAVPAGNHRRSRRRGHADRARHPHRPQHLHLPPSAGDADPARLCRQGAGTPALCAGRAHPVSRPCLPAGRSAAPRAALSGGDQRGHRRDRASRRACRATPWSRWRCARRATPCGSTPASSARWKRRTPPSVGKAILAWLPEDEIQPHSRRRHEALHRQDHHRISGA